jgi:RsiW-degrading membrane proteinase PrsW (M82 family)
MADILKILVIVISMSLTQFLYCCISNADSLDVFLAFLSGGLTATAVVATYFLGSNNEDRT